MEVRPQARAEPAGNHAQGPRTEAMRSIGRLKHAGFAEGRPRTMAEFAEERVDGPALPVA